MKLAFYIIFLNPIMLALYNYGAYVVAGLPGLGAILGLPAVFALLQHQSNEGLSGYMRYLLSMQLFFLSSLVGGFMIWHGIVIGSELWIIGGAFAALPGITLLALLVLFN